MIGTNNWLAICGRRSTLCLGLFLVIVSAISQIASAGVLVSFSDPSGLSGEAEFTLVGPFTLEVRLKNTSTGVPVGFDNSDQLLTGVSWDFGSPGFNGDSMIASGSVLTGPTSASVDFDITNVGSNADVSGEWGYGNMDGTGALTNFISALKPQAVPFGGANLDGPVNIDGPQGGLYSSSEPVALGGLGAIQDEVVSTLLLDTNEPAMLNLDFLAANGVRFEFGSDADFFTVFIPEPSAFGLACLGFLGLVSSTRSKRPAC